MDIGTIEHLCKALPHATDEIKWKSDWVFMVARKMFCVIDLEAVPTSVAFKVPDEDFDALSTAPHFKPAPYFAQHKWVTLTDIGKITPAHLKKHIQTSYKLVYGRLSKKAQRELGNDGKARP